MIGKGFAQVLGILGVIGAAVSIGWWYTFYTDVTKFLGVKGPLPTECIYTVGGPCGMVSGIANALGVAAYDPKIFWASGILCIIGLIGGILRGDDNFDKINHGGNVRREPGSLDRREPRADDRREPW